MVSAFFFHQFLHHSVFAEKHQQRHAEQVEDDGFAEQDLAAVDEEALHKRGRREHIRQHRADEHRIGQHDRHGHEPVLFDSRGKQTAQQRPGRADDDIERGDRGEDVGDQAAQREADGQRRLEHDEHA